MDRNKIIVKTSLIGIIINAILVSIKIIIGIASGSIAIILDAVNNTSDALTSVITIAGTRLSQKAPDKKHPYGYGRVEYFSTVVIAFIILIAGGSSFRESIVSIINKDVATYEWSTVFILIVACIIKFFMAKYTQKMGHMVESHSLMASGREAFFDACLSVGTLGAALISLLFHFSLEGWLGALISIAIVKSGIEMLGETISTLIGVRGDGELASEMIKIISKYPGVIGVYDIILHNYGPTQHIGTVHIEVDEDMSAKEIHYLTQNISIDIYDALEVILTVGIYSSVKSDPEALKMRNVVTSLCHEFPEILQVHGFYLFKGTIGFDLVIDFKTDATSIMKKIEDRLKASFPQYKYSIILDLDYSS